MTCNYFTMELIPQRSTQVPGKSFKKPLRSSRVLPCNLYTFSFLFKAFRIKPSVILDSCS